MLPATAAELLDNVAGRRAAVTSLRARAHVRTGVARLWTRQAVLVQRPLGVRIDVLSPFGLTLALGTRGDVFWAYPPAERTRYEGPATPANLARFVGTPVTVADLVDILLGAPPRREPAGPPHLEVTRERTYRLVVPIVGGAQELRFAGDTLALVGVQEVRAGEVTMRVGFGEYREGFPRLLEVEAPRSGSAATLAFDSVERNAALDPDLFAPPAADRVLSIEGAETVN
jgi:hypothetical protein